MLAIVFVTGAALAWIDGPRRTRLAPPAALVAGALVFLVGTSVTRWFVTPTADSQSRYIYILAALLLPALAAAVDSLIRRWRLLTPLVLGALMVATVKNATDFGGTPFTAQYFHGQKELTFALARSRFAVPGYVRPNPWYSIGWLRTADAEGELPAAANEPVVPLLLERHIHFLLSIAQLAGQPPNAQCHTFRHGLVLRTARGARYGFRFGSKPDVGDSFFVQDAVVATLLGPNGRPVDNIGFKVDYGRTLEFEVSGMSVRLRAADPHQSLVLCRPPR